MAFCFCFNAWCRIWATVRCKEKFVKSSGIALGILRIAHNYVAAVG